MYWIKWNFGGEGIHQIKLRYMLLLELQNGYCELFGAQINTLASIVTK